MFETVVIATDGSDSGRRAVTVGLDLADRFDADIHAISVVDSGDIEGAPDAISADLERELDGVAREAVQAVERAADRPVTTAVRSGYPAPTVCAYAETVGASEIVLGTRGRHGEHRALLGSVAERVLRLADPAVITVRQDDGSAEQAKPADTSPSPGEGRA